MHNLFISEIAQSLPDVIPTADDPEVNETAAGNWQSRFPVSELAVASIAVATREVAAWTHANRPSTPQHAVRATRSLRRPPSITVDRRLASLWFQGSILPGDFRLPAAWDPLAGDYRCGERWIKLHTNAPHHRRAALDALGLIDTPDVTREQVAAAVRGCNAHQLESEIIEGGGCAAQLRTLDAWRVHPQGKALATEPLIRWTKMAAQDVQPHRPPASVDQPLRGLRVLDLTRVLAGPVATRFLARFGADVLRIDPPWWEEPGVVPEVTLGKRCAGLDLTQAPDRQRFEQLLETTDLLVHGYRPGALERLGYGPQTLQSINPGAIDISLCAYGWTGPWADRRGFDSLVQMSSGIAHPGSDQGPDQGLDQPPRPLPVQALDHATGYLMAAAAVRALRLRHTTGVIMRARLSLARTAQLLIDGQTRAAAMPSSPATELDTTVQPDGPKSDLDSFHEVTSWGHARRLAFPAAIEGSAPGWTQPATELRAALPRWLPR